MSNEDVLKQYRELETLAYESLGRDEAFNDKKIQERIRTLWLMSGKKPTTITADRLREVISKIAYKEQGAFTCENHDPRFVNWESITILRNLLKEAGVE